MACFLVSTVEAAVVTVAAKIAERKEAKIALSGKKPENAVKISFSRKLKWLRNMLWGGSALLAFEHVWHGEIVTWFPFLTAAEDPESFAEMLREVSTVGVAMAALVTTVWLGMVGVSALIEKRAAKAKSEKEEEA